MLQGTQLVIDLSLGRCEHDVDFQVCHHKKLSHLDILVAIGQMSDPQRQPRQLVSFCLRMLSVKGRQMREIEVRVVGV
jgi:hypothetical protein